MIEYQRRTYKNEITALRQQILEFSEEWIRRLDELETTHDKELRKVHSWLTKVETS